MVTLFIFLKDFVFASFWTTWVASFLATGKSLGEAAVALGTFFIAIALLEVPTGFIADRFGKKLSSLSGMFSVALAFTINGFNPPSGLSALAFGLAGLGVTLMSGASIAWLYDLAKKEELFHHDSFFLRTEMIGRLATILGAIISVWLLKIDPSFVWFGIGLVGFVAFIVGFRLPNDPSHEPQTVTSTGILQETFSHLMKPAIFWLIMASVFFGFETAIRDIIYQPYIIKLNHGNEWYLALFQSSLALIRLGGIKFYQRHLLRFNRPLVLATLSMLIFALAEFHAAHATNYWKFFALYGLAIFTLGWYFPIRDAQLNRNLTGRSQATVLSFNSMAESAMAGLGCLVLAGQVELAAIQSFWSWGGTCLLLTAGAYWLSGRSKGR